MKITVYECDKCGKRKDGHDILSHPASWYLVSITIEEATTHESTHRLKPTLLCEECSRLVRLIVGDLESGYKE